MRKNKAVRLYAFSFRRKTSPQSELLFAFTCDDSFERVVAIPSQLFTPDIPRKLEKQLRKISRPASAQAAVPVQVQVREEEGFQLINILVGGSESLDTSVENYLSILRVLGEDGWKVGTSVAPFGTKVDGVMLHKDIQ